jgi:hypothetical protein
MTETDLRPIVKYEFRSAKGGATVVISSRLGEASARGAAMEHFWGPGKDDAGTPSWMGQGLHLISTNQVPVPSPQD